MSLYRKFSVSIWEGDFAAKASGDGDLWTVCTYLMTNRHNRFGIGLYRLPLVFIADATGFALETCRRCISDASEMRFARYDDARKTVFVVEQARHEWGESPNVKRNDVAGLVKGLPELFFDLRKSFLVKDFCDRYEEGWKGVFDALETHPRRVADALKTRPAGARAQNRMQDQEQEAGNRKQEEEGGARSDEAPRSVRENTPPPPPALPKTPLDSEDPDSEDPDSELWRIREACPEHQKVDFIGDQYYRAKARWHVKLRKKFPRKRALTKAQRSAIAACIGEGHSLQSLVEALGNVAQNAFHMGCFKNGNGRPRIGICDIFSLGNETRPNAIEVLLENEKEDAELGRRKEAIVGDGEDPGLDLPARLENLAAALPPSLAGRNVVAEQIRAFEGGAEAIEKNLAELEREVVRQATEALPPAEVDAVERELADSLATITQRLPADKVERAGDRLREEILRRRMKLPVLSIFSPEATP